MANTEEGTRVGQFPKEARARLKEVIIQAEGILKQNSLKLQDSDEMTSKLLEAIKAYQGAEIKEPEQEIDLTVLKELIQAAKEIFNEAEIYTASSYEALQKAIQNTEAILGSIVTEEALEVEMAKLEKAIAELVETEKLLSANAIKAMIEPYEAEGEVSDQKSIGTLTTHLTAIAQYEKQDASEKVIKHLERFKLLLEQQEKNDFISEETSLMLHAATNDLIKQWQSE